MAGQAMFALFAASGRFWCLPRQQGDVKKAHLNAGIKHDISNDTKQFCK